MEIGVGRPEFGQSCSGCPKQQEPEKIPKSPAHPEDSPYQGEAKGGNFILRISLWCRSRKGADGFRQDGHGGKSENSSFSTLRHRGRLDGGWGLKMEEEPPIFTQRRGGVLASERILKVRNRGWRRSGGEGEGDRPGRRSTCGRGNLAVEQKLLAKTLANKSVLLSNSPLSSSSVEGEA